MHAYSVYGMVVVVVVLAVVGLVRFRFLGCNNHALCTNIDTVPHTVCLRLNQIYNVIYVQLVYCLCETIELFAYDYIHTYILILSIFVCHPRLLRGFRDDCRTETYHHHK